MMLSSRLALIQRMNQWARQSGTFLPGEEIMESNEYRCAMCDGVFKNGWSDEEAIAEAEGFFPGVPASERVVVCDDCFTGIHPSKHPHLVEGAIADYQSLKGKKS